MQEEWIQVNKLSLLGAYASGYHEQTRGVIWRAPEGSTKPLRLREWMVSRQFTQVRGEERGLGFHLPPLITWGWRDTCQHQPGRPRSATMRKGEQSPPGRRALGNSDTLPTQPKAWTSPPCWAGARLEGRSFSFPASLLSSCSQLLHFGHKTDFIKCTEENKFVSIGSQTGSYLWRAGDKKAGPAMAGGSWGSTGFTHTAAHARQKQGAPAVPGSAGLRRGC